MLLVSKRAPLTLFPALLAHPLAELAVLIDDPTAHRAPSHSVLSRWNAERMSDVKAQLAAAEAKEAAERTGASRAMSDEAVRKRRERGEKRAAAARAKAIAEGAVEPAAAAPVLEERPATPSGIAIGASVAYTVTVPASSAADLPWYAPEATACATLEDARAAGVWTYPSTPFERAKCAVFRDLWEKGHYMGGGIKFGGDFLVYPGMCGPLRSASQHTDGAVVGDPLRYHSHFVATVHESPVSTLRPMEIVAHGRLGTATKKAHLLCGWDEKKQEVSYYSIEWAGFG